MGLAAGTRLGPYEVGRPLGAGGMGEVYRARDTRLGRDVAIKVLAGATEDQPDARERFQREARVSASLAHPHIAALFDVGSEGGTLFLVMELLEGETLAARLGRGPLPLDEALRLAIQIADALAAAHGHGIVHRDLKPGNVMLTKSGAKVLDFGLVKLREDSAAKTRSVLPAAVSGTAPTLPSPLTGSGAVLGTIQYMAPEQLQAKPVDHRADIFAFGALLHEMVTGRRAFEGDSEASRIAAILDREPTPMAKLAPAVPATLDHVVRTCLAKDPEDRWQTARDVEIELRWILDRGADDRTAIPARGERRGWIPWAALPLVFAAGLAAAFLLLRPAAAPASRPLRASVVPAGIEAPSFAGPASGSLTVSPDGRYLTFTAAAPGERLRLWLRPVDGLDARPIPGTEDAIFPFWSPDSRSLAFFVDGKLKRLDLAGGPPVSVCEAPDGRSGSWSREGVILFSPDSLSPIFRVPAAGGKPVPATRLDPSRGESTHRWAWFLPDGRHFLYLAGSHGEVETSERNAVYVASLDSGRADLLLHARSNVVYASGQLLYVRGESLVAQPFDAARLAVTGDPWTVAPRVEYASPYLRGAFGASDGGVLAYAQPLSRAVQFCWLDRGGYRLALVGAPVEFPYPDVRLSPDGRRFVGGVVNPDTAMNELWLFDASDGAAIRFAGDSVNDRYFGVWAPDGRRLAYAGGHRKDDLRLKAVGAATEEVLVSDDRLNYPNDWSADGRYLVYSTADRAPPSGGRSDIWVLPMGGGGKPFPFVATTADEWGARFSPDGRWMLYVSDESGRYEVYLAPFLGPGERRLVSRGGALGMWTPSAWTRGGREIVYAAPDGTIMSVDVTWRETTPLLGTPQPLFRPDATVIGDVTADGERFLMGFRPYEANRAPITLVTDWQSRGQVSVYPLSIYQRRADGDLTP